MKRIQSVFVLLIAIIALSCTKEVIGPAGPEGPQGEPGESAYVFEYANVDFVAPDYEVFLPYPDDFEGVSSDVAIVYLLWDVTTDDDGNQLEIWRQLPQTIHTELGEINYNFDFTSIDVRLFLIPEFDPVELQPIDTDDWVVRTVIIPGNFWGSITSIDYSDYYAVKEAFGLPDLVTRSTVKRRE